MTWFTIVVLMILVFVLGLMLGHEVARRAAEIARDDGNDE